MKMRLIVHLGWMLATATVAQANTPFWGDKTSMPIDTDPAVLTPGQFVWQASVSPTGPIVVIVSLDEQRAYVYRNGIRIGVSSVSTGRAGHETPTGVFTILQKDKDHHSSIYNNAAMPYSERLTWGGVALHAGGLPGHPSSHGCVHLPTEFAKDLFEVSSVGMTVVVASNNSAPGDVVHPTFIAPVDAITGVENRTAALAEKQSFRWQPEKATQGPISILLSAADRNALVFRGGTEIGRASFTIDNPAEPLGTHVFVLMEDASKTSGSDLHPLRWMMVAMHGQMGGVKAALDPQQAARIHLPLSFRDLVDQVLHPGATMLVTEAAVLESTTGVQLVVVTNDHQVSAESPE